jgi:L-threonylcarbamoyladenylate synthase
MTYVRKPTNPEIIDAAYALLKGNLVAFPTETVYGLGADASNEKAVARIYAVKGRPISHPLILHIASINNLEMLVKKVPDYALRLAKQYWPGPMTLILNKSEFVKDFVTGGQNTVGIRVPAHKTTISLLKEFESLGGKCVAAPSANRFGAVSPTTANSVYVELNNFLGDSDRILDGGSCNIGIESTIINCTNEQPVILRPGAITTEMIQKTLRLELDQASIITRINEVRTPGLMNSHYSPSAKVILSGPVIEGDGFIALKSIKTPPGAIRLASPSSNKEYAQVLYHAFRLADKKRLHRVYAVIPNGGGISVAIIDRLTKAAYGDQED